MSEYLDHRLDQRIRAALNDLDHRVAHHVAGSTARELPGSGMGEPFSRLALDEARPSRRSGPARRGGRLVPALAGFAVVALLATVGWLARPDEPAPPALPLPNPSVTTPAPSMTTPPSSRSQSVADADRDQVHPALARLTVAQRVEPVEPVDPKIATRLTAKEGVWLISRPDILSRAKAGASCLAQPRSAPKRHKVCEGYSEILLLTPDLNRILRAYPIPELPAQWLVLTRDAVFCGRQGDGGIPDSMVCRIDRSTKSFIGRAFPEAGLVDASPPSTFAGWPGKWSTNPPTRAVGFDRARLASSVLQISTSKGKSTIALDPETLIPRP